MIAHDPRRRADRGTLIVRASVMALGLAAAVGLQPTESEPKGAASWPAGQPSMPCSDANAPFAFQ